jgi:lysine-specific demethylase 8
MLFLQNLSVDEKRRFLAFTGAHATTLAAGETLFIPALWWHYAEYASTSLAFNLRIARNAYNRFLGDEVAPDWRLQAFSRLLLRAPPDEQLEHAFARLRHVVRARHATLDAKHDAVSGLLTALCEDWVPQAVVSRYVHLAYDRWERANARLFYEARTTFGPDVHPARRSA